MHHRHGVLPPSMCACAAVLGREVDDLVHLHSLHQHVGKRSTFGPLTLTSSLAQEMEFHIQGGGHEPQRHEGIWYAIKHGSSHEIRHLQHSHGQIGTRQWDRECTLERGTQEDFCISTATSLTPRAASSADSLSPVYRLELGRMAT